MDTEELAKRTGPSPDEFDAMIAETERIRREKPRAKTAATMRNGYRSEYESQRAIHEQLGVSVEDYIEQREIEDGLRLEPLNIPSMTGEDADVVRRESGDDDEHGLWPEEVRKAMKKI